MPPMSSRAPQLALCSLVSLVALSGCFVSDEEIKDRSDYDGDGIPLDSDCDDTRADVGAEVSWFADVDGDGFGAGEEQTGCPDEQPSTNTSDNADDCDDSNPSAFPGAEERYYDGVDQDCAGEDADGNGAIDDFDQDGDGYEQDVDCDDLDASLKPDDSIDEVPYDGIDNDCNLETGDGDKDGDGYWSADYASKAPGSALSPPAGLEDDCYDDVDDPEQPAVGLNGLTAPGPAEVHPGATTDAPYDGVDARCDGDEGEFDADGDGYNSAAYTNRDDIAGSDCQDCTSACSGEPDWTADIDSDRIHPDANEVYYDGIDQDCKGVDSFTTGIEDDFDQDADGHVVDGATDVFGNVGDDCLDTDDRLAPGNTDIPANGLDEDCGGENDYDVDLDGYVPDAAFGLATIGVPGSETTPGGDCVDDTSRDGSVSTTQQAEDYNPGKSDSWGDGYDFDCAGNDDYDRDGDGYRSDDYATSSDLATYQQTQIAVAHDATTADDCDDRDAAVNPGVAEVGANDTDDNCDGGAAPEGIEGENDASLFAGAVVGDYAYGFGLAVASGDLDGDGQAEVVVGDNSYDDTESNVGQVVWFSGTEVVGAEVAASDFGGQVMGDDASDQAGYAIGIFDITDDGNDDLILTATNVAGSGGTGNDGGVYVFAGPLSTSSTSAFEGVLSDADYAGTGLSGGYAGRSFATGEVTGDSVVDLIVAAPYDDAGSYSNNGALYIWTPASATGNESERDAEQVYGDYNSGYLGEGATVTGDLNGDGNAEIIVGSHTFGASFSNSGIVQVLETPITDGAYASSHTSTYITGGSESAQCGRALATADFDADGYDDLAVGCPNANSNAGAVAVFLGANTMTSSAFYTSGDLLLRGSRATYGGQMGYSLAFADVDGSGKPDLLGGERYYTPNTSSYYLGRVAMLYAGTTGTVDADDADGQVIGDNGSGFLANSLTAGSDVDGDGYEDLVVGRTGYNIDGTYTGDVLLFTGGEW